MYRFSFGEEEWILRFAPQIAIEEEEKQNILIAMLQIGEEINSYSHGNAFIMFTKKIGAIIFVVETIPSFILTVSNIIPEENWYYQNSIGK